MHGARAEAVLENQKRLLNTKQNFFAKNWPDLIKIVVVILQLNHVTTLHRTGYSPTLVMGTRKIKMRIALVMGQFTEPLWRVEKSNTPLSDQILNQLGS